VPKFIFEPLEKFPFLSEAQQFAGWEVRDNRRLGNPRYERQLLTFLVPFILVAT